MTRLIDADAIEFPDANYWEETHEDEDYGYGMGVGDCIEIIEKMPTIDAEPVRHGKNIATDYDDVDQFVCSECGIELQGWYRVERDEDDGEETYHEYRLRYCPNCGARMDEERKEHD